MGQRGRPKYPDILTPREWEVLALLREGLSNDHIASRLGVSLATARYHVSEILGKLGVSTREQAAAWRPDEHRRELLALAAPLALLRRLHAGPAAGGALAAAALAGVGLLAWGVVATGGNGGGHDAPVTRASDRDPGRGMKATEAGILPWTTYRISGGDLPHAITVPFTEYLLATDFGRPFSGGPQASAPPAGETVYRIDFVRADDLATPVGSAGMYAGGAIPVLQPPSIGAPSSSPSWQEPPANVAAMLDRYIALGRAGAVPERPTLAESIAAAQGAGTTSVTVGGRELTPADRDLFLSLFGSASPVRLGVRGYYVGQRALKAVTVQVQLDAETLTFAYIPPGSVSSDGLLWGTTAGNWEFSALLDPPAYAQNAYAVPTQIEGLMTRLGFAGGAPPQDIETRIMPLLEADMTMRIDRVTLSDGANDVSVQDINPDSVECAPGLDVCGPDAAPLPADRKPLTLTVWRRGVDPFPEAQQPAEYSYYPPGTAGARGVLVQRKAGADWNATLGSDNGTPYYASGATDAALRAAVRELGS